MGKTILELFRSRNENTGEVAEKKYAPRDSKEIGIQTNSLLINNSAVYGVNLLRRNIGVRLSESRLEQEGVGIRPLYTLSTPVLYGTDVLRLETQRTDQTEGMKNSANGGEGNGGLLGGTIQSVKSAAITPLTKLGVKFPSDLNPTTYYKKLEITDKSQTPTVLSDIRSNGEGNIAGKVLSQPATPDQLVKNSTGAAVSFLKTKARGAIFGEKSTTGFADASVSIANGTTINYGSSDDAIPSVSSDIIGEKVNIAKDANGRRYSKTFNLPLPNDDTVQSSNGSFVKSTEYNESSDGFNGLARKYRTGIVQPHVTRRLNGVGSSKSYSKLTNNNRNGETKDISKQSLISRRGMQNGADIINQSGVINNTTEAFRRGGDTSNLGWNYDFIPLKINRLNDNKTIYFRSTITGLSETFSPSWDSSKFIGNPFNYYTYSGIERSVSFNLKVYALNGREMVSMWDKLKFLAELTYPAGYTNTSAVVPPFIKFTLGSFYDRKEGFIESLTYTVDDTTPWEVGLNTVKPKPTNRENAPDQGYFFDNVANSSIETRLKGRVDGTPLDNYRLPMIVDVQMTVKFVESRINTTNAKLYDFGKPGSA